MTSTFFLAALVLADPLVVKNAGGFADGAVAVTQKGDKKVELKVQKQYDPAAVAELIKGKLKDAQIAQNGDAITITGVSAADVLDKLSGVSAEPMAQNLFAMDMPEAGGSIRVGKTVDLASTEPKHESKDRFRARVVEVSRGDYPEVTLKLKRGGDVRNAEIQKKLKYTFSARVAFVRANGALDLSHAVTKKNLVATYLKPGDEVNVHIAFVKTEQGEEAVIDWIERL